jgi:hypothetical protein
LAGPFWASTSAFFLFASAQASLMALFEESYNDNKKLISM